MPLDLQPTEADTAAFAAMAAEEPIVETPAEQPQEAPKGDQPTGDQQAAQPQQKTANAEEKAGDQGDQPNDADKDKPARQVDLRALLEERGKRKARETELEEARAEIARLRGAQPAPAKQEEQVRADTDPIAVIERHEREMAEWREARQRETQMGEFQRTVVAKEAEYLAANPDYPKMVEFLKETRVREMRDGLGFSDAQIHQALSTEAAQTAHYAMANDLNPAEVFARLAVAKGWKAETPPPADTKPAPAERLATIAAGQKAAKGLSGAGGGAPSAAPTLAAMLEMDGAEFDQMWKSGAVKRLMG